VYCDGLKLLINVCLLRGFLLTVVWRPHLLFIVLEWLYGPAVLYFCLRAYIYSVRWRSFSSVLYHCCKL